VKIICKKYRDDGQRSKTTVLLTLRRAACTGNAGGLAKERISKGCLDRALFGDT